MKSRTVNIRDRDDEATQVKGDLIPLEEAIKKMVALRGAKGERIASALESGQVQGLSEKEAKLRAVAAKLGQNFDEL